MKFKLKWKKLLNNIAEQNKSIYGEGGINCCNLNNTGQNVKSTKKDK